MMHGLFIIMGGDHLFECISKKTGSSNGRILQEDDKPLHLLQKSKLQSSDEYKSFVMPTEVDHKGSSQWDLEWIQLVDQQGWSRKILSDYRHNVD